MSDKLRGMLIRQEGLRLVPYRDSVGKLTIGIGRNLEDKGITEEEAYILFDNDVIERTHQCSTIPGFNELDKVRQDVLIDMVFNMGITRVLGFKKMLAALKIKDWNEAADQMLDSKWSEQVGNRAIELAEMIRTGEYP